MSGMLQRKTIWRLTAAGAALAVAVTGCSGSDDAQPDSKRECAAVQPDDLSKLMDTTMTLQKAQQGSTVCRFVSDDGATIVQLNVEGPVEKGFPKLLLTDPEKVDGVGAEAYLSSVDTPLGTRLITRNGGAMLTVDLQANAMGTKARKELITEIAEAGVENLPDLEVKQAEGKRGDEACEPFTSDEVAAALGGVPTITPTTPPGSCTLVVEANDLTVNASVLMERGATEDQLDALVSNVETAEATKVGKAPAYWIVQEGASGGQLDVLDDDRILQVAVIAGDLDADQSQAIATAVAKAAIA